MKPEIKTKARQSAYKAVAICVTLSVMFWIVIVVMNAVDFADNSESNPGVMSWKLYVVWSLIIIAFIAYLSYRRTLRKLIGPSKK